LSSGSFIVMFVYWIKINCSCWFD